MTLQTNTNCHNFSFSFSTNRIFCYHFLKHRIFVVFVKDFLKITSRNIEKYVNLNEFTNKKKRKIKNVNWNEFTDDSFSFHVYDAFDLVCFLRSSFVLRSSLHDISYWFLFWLLNDSISIVLHNFFHHSHVFISLTCVLGHFLSSEF